MPDKDNQKNPDLRDAEDRPQPHLDVVEGEDETIEESLRQKEQKK